MYTELNFDTNSSEHALQEELKSAQNHILILEDDLTYKPLWMHVIDKISPHSVVDWVQSEEAAERYIKARRKLGQKYDLVVADVFLSGRKTGIDLWSKFADVIENFVFVSSLSREKFDILISSEDYSYPIYLQKPLRANVCADIVQQLLSTDKKDAL